MKKYMFCMFSLLLCFSFVTCKLTIDKDGNNNSTITVLCVKNESSWPIWDITYSGGITYYDEWGIRSENNLLNKGKSCRVKVIGKEAAGFVHFWADPTGYGYDYVQVKTQERYTIPTGETKSIDIGDNTPIVDHNGNPILFKQLFE